jgi:endonuclease/exonuclease/phosphatase family metal-dependent hydrolase
LAGDLNADPNQGDSLPAIRRLLESPWLHDPRPLSEGAQHRWPGETERAANTAIWGLRADYLLPSTGLTVIDSQVVWPLPHHPMAQLLNIASDHRPVTLTLQIP